jgi:hypothetical protein
MSLRRHITVGKVLVEYGNKPTTGPSIAMNQDETPSQGHDTPMQHAFSLFRARVQADPSLADDIKAAVEQDLSSASPEKYQALRAVLLKRSVHENQEA